MNTAAPRIEVDETLRLALVDGAERHAVRLAPEQAIRLASSLLAFALRPAPPTAVISGGTSSQET